MVQAAGHSTCKVSRLPEFLLGPAEEEMTVYVDDMRASYGRMTMCHMVADTVEELHAMADKIGVQRKWFQNKTRYPHYDIALSKRALAVLHGASEIKIRQTPAIAKACRYEYIARTGRNP